MHHLQRTVAFVRPYRKQAVWSLLLLTALVVLDLALPRLIQHVIDRGIARGDQAVVVQTALLMLGISAASVVIALGNNLFSVRAGEGVARDLREALFLKIQSFSFGNLDRQKTGVLLVRLTSDVAAIKGLIQISLRIGTRAPLMFLGSAVLMVSTSPRLALMLLPLLLVTSALIALFILKSEPLFRSVQGKLDVLNGVLQESIAGARVVKSLVRNEFEQQRFEQANSEMTARSVKVMQLLSAMNPVLVLCINVGMVLVIGAGGRSAIEGELSLGEIVAFTNYMLSTMTPLVMMTMLSNMWAAGLASSARVHEVLSLQPEVLDSAGARVLPANAPARVELRDVSFAYRNEGGDPVLKDVDLRAEAGQTVAILGATGSGKSTLVQLIPRFYDVDRGQVLYADQDVRDVTQASLLDHVAMVPQEARLFAGTVRDNIRYGKPDADDAEVEAAARVAQAHDFIQELPDKYDAAVAPRGANLSGGQKQRIAIARALLTEPDVLILDDSTSAVDIETETKFQAALAERRRERTTFIVAQRISTVLRADKIIVLEHGRVVASGTHTELLRDSAVYQEIYESQLGSDVAPGTLQASATP